MGEKETLINSFLPFVFQETFVQAIIATLQVIYAVITTLVCQTLF
jgi:hypothetical protein